MEMETNKVMKAKSLMVAMLSLSLVVSGCADKNDTTSKAESDSAQQAKQEQGVTISDIIKNKKDFVAYETGLEQQVHFIWLFENGKIFTYQVTTGNEVLASEMEGKDINDVKHIIAKTLENASFVKNGMAIFEDETLWQDPELIVNKEGFGFMIPYEQLVSKTIDEKGSYYGKHQLEYRWSDLKHGKVLVSKTIPEFGTVMPNLSNLDVNDALPSVFGNIDNSNEKYIELSQVEGSKVDADLDVRMFITKTKDIQGLKSEDYKKIADNKTFFYQEQKTE